jgi:arylsulfatase A-like enzyme
LPATLATAPIAAAYDEKILEVDFALARLFEELEERGVLDELLIVISADHGESMTGHDYFFGHALLYNDVLHVPLLMRLPGGRHSGRRIRDVVQLVDLFPTLIDIVRGDTSDGFHGASFLPTLRDGSPSRGFAYAEWGMMEQAAVEAGGWKLIASQPRYSRYQTQVTSPRLDRAALGALVPELARGFPDDETVARLLQGRPEAKRLLESLVGPFYELYDLGRDPHEADDLSGREPERVQALLQYIAEGRRLSELARQQARTLPRVSPNAIDPSELDRLGYGGK